ncbi:membrane protein [gut metagenome]|uniref:Membrane protein n=1 Tax=gut metagenome TaxID=749906 RepID=J9G7B2_9ZZZZ
MPSGISTVAIVVHIASFEFESETSTRKSPYNLAKKSTFISDTTHVAPKSTSSHCSENSLSSPLCHLLLSASPLLSEIPSNARLGSLAGRFPDAARNLDARAVLPLSAARFVFCCSIFPLVSVCISSACTTKTPGTEKLVTPSIAAITSAATLFFFIPSFSPSMYPFPKFLTQLLMHMDTIFLINNPFISSLSTLFNISIYF